MKRPFDRIVGPDGVWKFDNENKDAPVRTLADMDEREEFVLRCLNAAANLYGVITHEEFVSLYNGYAKGHDAPVSDPLTLDELDRLLDFFLDDCPESDSTSIEDVVNEPDVWFATSSTKDGALPVIAYYILEDPDVPDFVASFHKVPLLVLPEDDFLVYEDPMCAEETKESRAFEKFIKKEYGLKRHQAEFAVMSIQSDLRINGAKITTALEHIRDSYDWEPSDRDAFLRLINAVSPIVSTTRTWEGRGRTQQELSRMGACPQFEKEDIYDVFGLDDDSGRDDNPVRDDEDDGWDDDWDDDENDSEDDWDDDEGDGEDDDWDEEGEMIYPEDVPLSVYNGPIDFKFVKDAERREAKVETYEDVRQITQDFVRKFVMPELMPEERRKSAVRLGFLKENEGLERLDPTLDCVVGDFASMLDDSGGEPAVRRVQAKKSGAFDAFDRRAASYYANYRYTWLEVLASKAGVGVKCRDLLTGEELFLMEKSLSQGEVKGMTVCAGIAPMEDVYMSVGVISPARFENPAKVLKNVLAHLGLPTETPVRLDAADQARFAAETIRRIHANGNSVFVNGV